MKTRLMLSVAGALALAACGGGDNEAAEADSTLAEATPTETAPAAAAMPSTPQDWVAMAASSDMYEMEAARLAQQQGQAQGVKDFAAMMLADHGSSSDKLKAAAQAQQLTVPAAMMPQHQALLDELRSATDSFDEVYARQQVAAHEQALQLMRAYPGGATGAAAATPDAAAATPADASTASPGGDALAAFAAETAPVIEGHLERARALPGG